jgi:hypothetical protein
MIRRLSIVLLSAAFLLSAGTTGELSAQDEPAAKEDRPQRTEQEKAERRAKGKGKGKGKGKKKQNIMSLKGGIPTEISSAFPIGREFVGVSIPSYEDEQLKSVMRADSIIRIDDRFLDLVNLVISVYNSEGEHETTISMDEAAYDLTTQELASKTPAKIEQPKFTMTGDKMTFDTQSQVSKLVGNVEVIIPDAGNLFPTPGFPVPGRK